MRIAVLIIALSLSLLIGLQSCAVYVSGSLLKEHDTSSSGALGLLMAFLYILGAAFVLKLPKISVGIFIVAALIGGLGASASKFSDIAVWGIVSFVLAVMSYLGSRPEKAISP